MKFSYFRRREDNLLLKKYRRCFEIYDRFIREESGCITLVTNNDLYFNTKYGNTVCLKNS